ncbi:MAG: carbonic anhydrase [Hyphomonadaceae bacterium]|nr:carbonic anhydrase [Hyphomonadaceae bacterium]
MERLLEGYRAFRSKRWPYERALYEELAEGQKPDFLVIACCDSRVDPATIFDARPGELFVIRNVANLVPPFEPGAGLHGTSAAIEFAVRKLEVRTILVMGHAQCGGCMAALDHTIGQDMVFLQPWVALLEPAVSRCAHEADPQTALERESVKVSLENLRGFPFIAEAIETRGLKLAGARFGVADGRLELLDEATGAFQFVT